MSDENSVTKSLRERLGGGTEDRLGRALSDLLENPLLTGALGRAFDAREKAAQAQEVAMGALNIPSAADIERLTRRVRSVSYRLEGIEDGLARLDRAPGGGGVEARLSAIEQRLELLTYQLKEAAERQSAPSATATAPARKAAAGGRSEPKTTRAAKGARGAGAKGPRAVKAKPDAA
ncbi:MAG TPA: hypothetical protein VGH78_05290 [Solirubrobacteraceae bacterium]